MTELHPDLFSLLDAVVIHSPECFSVCGQVHELADSSVGDLSTEPARDQAILSALRNDLYKYLYIRPQGPWFERHGDEFERRQRLAALAAANVAPGTWNRGWVVREIDRDGQLVLSKDNLTIWAAKGEVRARNGEIQEGQTCAVRFGAGQRNRVPGFYFAFGGAEDEDDEADSEPFVRYYWHLSSEAAVPFVAAATKLLSAARVPFSLKVLADPGEFRRSDAGLIFVRKQHHSRVFEAIARIHETVASGLRPSVPMFTKRLAPGLGAADDPTDRLSFGDHRCKLAARALWRSFLRGEHDRAARAATLAAVYAEERLDPRHPYLAAGSTDDSHLTIAPAHFRSPAITSSAGLPSCAIVPPLGSSAGPISPREAATRIGQSLCRGAIWDPTGRCCNWIGRVFSRDENAEGPPRTTAAALGPDLHEGSAGIALFLTELHAATGNDEFRRTAEAALARSRLPLVPPPAVASDAAPGELARVREAAVFFLRTLIEDPGLKDRLRAATQTAINAVIEAIDAYILAPRCDATIRAGLAGLGDVLLSAGEVLEDRSLLDRARALAQTLIDTYSQRGDWPTGLPCGGPNPSLWLGTAGIGYWLLRLDDPKLVPCWLLLDRM